MTTQLARLLLESGLNAKPSGCAFYHCVAAYRNWHLHDVAANRKWHLISSVETEKKLFELIDLSMSKKIDMNYLHGDKSFLRFGIEVKELRCLFAKHLFSESFSIAPIHNKGVLFLNLIDCFRRESSSVTAKWLTRYTTEIVDLFGYDRVFKSREIFERSDLRAFAKFLFQNKYTAVWLLDMYRRYRPPLGRSHDEELLFRPLNLAVGYGVLELIDLLYDNGLELDYCQDAFPECFNRELNGFLRGYRFRINRLDVMRKLFQRGVDNESNDLYTITVSRFQPRGPSRALNNSCLCLPVYFLTSLFSISNARAQMRKLNQNVETRWRIKQELKLSEIVKTLLNLGCPFNSEPDQSYLTRKNHLCVFMVPVGYGRSVLCQLFKAGAGLAYLHNIAQTARAVPQKFAYRKPISPLKSQLYICQAAVLAGFTISDEDLQDIRYLNFDKDQIEWFSRMKESPLSLMCQCRSAIRRELSLRSANRTILPRINGLPLPDILRMYIRYEGSACEIDLETDYY